MTTVPPREALYSPPLLGEPGSFTTASFCWTGVILRLLRLLLHICPSSLELPANMSWVRSRRMKPTTTSTTMMESPLQVMTPSLKWTSNPLEPHQHKEMTWHYACQWLGFCCEPSWQPSLLALCLTAGCNVCKPQGDSVYLTCTYRAAKSEILGLSE